MNIMTTTTYPEDRAPESMRALTSEKPWRFSWGAALAGAAISVGIWFLLHVLGLGAGLTVIDPDDAGSLRGAGLTTGIWSLIVPIISMFVGGFAAAKVAGPITRLGGAIHGAVLWSLATMASTILVVSLVSSLVGGATRLGGQAMNVAGQAIGDVPAQLVRHSGISTDDLVMPINERLRAAGKPAITGDQIGTATRDAVQSAAREGRLDREMLTKSLADNTALSQADARAIATTVEQRWNEQSAQVRQAADQAGTAALQAAETTGKGLIGLFFAMLLGLGAAIVGTTLGVTRAQLAIAERANARAETLVERHA